MNIDEMSADQVNELMATDIMGWHREGASWYDVEDVWMAYADNVFREPAWSPYDDIADAWEVVEVLRQQHHIGITVSTCGPKSQTLVFTTFNGTKSAPIWAETPPLAICYAALKAIKED